MFHHNNNNHHHHHHHHRSNTYGHSEIVHNNLSIYSMIFHVCSCVVCVFQWFSCAFTCGVFFNHFLVCSRVVCVLQWFSCVLMCGVCFSMLFLCVSRVLWCVFFNDILVCSRVVCFSGVWQEVRKPDDSFGGGGQICYKYVPSTCYIFYHPPKVYKSH